MPFCIELNHHRLLSFRCIQGGREVPLSAPPPEVRFLARKERWTALHGRHRLRFSLNFNYPSSRQVTCYPPKMSAMVYIDQRVWSMTVHFVSTNATHLVDRARLLVHILPVCIPPLLATPVEGILRVLTQSPDLATTQPPQQIFAGLSRPTQGHTLRAGVCTMCTKPPRRRLGVVC